MWETGLSRRTSNLARKPSMNFPYRCAGTFVAITGNGVQIAEDMVRRLVLCNLNANRPTRNNGSLPRAFYRAPPTETALSLGKDFCQLALTGLPMW